MHFLTAFKLFQKTQNKNLKFKTCKNGLTKDRIFVTKLYFFPRFRS